MNLRVFVQLENRMLVAQVPKTFFECVTVAHKKIILDPFATVNVRVCMANVTGILKETAGVKKNLVVETVPLERIATDHACLKMAFVWMGYLVTVHVPSATQTSGG